jgi:hypothetical protein
VKLAIYSSARGTNAEPISPSARFWDKKNLIDIMKACVPLHNMIIEDERDMNLKFFFDNIGSRVRSEKNPDRIQTFLETYRQIKNSATHTHLNQDLIEHHWQLHGAK